MSNKKLLIFVRFIGMDNILTVPSPCLPAGREIKPGHPLNSLYKLIKIQGVKLKNLINLG